MTTQDIPGIKMLLEVREVATALGCGRTYVYELIRRGELGIIKLDRLTRVPVSEVQDFVARKSADQMPAWASGHAGDDMRRLTRHPRGDSPRRRPRR